jgi:RNA polymerase sigma-70 factor (ECF subfamily)
MVYGVCRAMLRDVHEAEDASQQAFLSAYRALLGGAHVRDSGAWLATIARNECRGRIAAGMRTPLPVAEEDLAGIAACGDESEQRLQAEVLRAALGELPDRQRDAVVLRYLYGLRYSEVATALGISRPATEALLFRARRAMRHTLRPVAGAVLVVPLAVRDELALAIPGFSTAPETSAAALGVTGGLLAKLTAGSVGAKVATAVVAASAVGVVAAVEPDPSGQIDGREPRPAAVVQRSVDDAGRSDSSLRSDGERSRSLDGRESDGGDDADRASGHVDVAGKAERRLSGSDDESRPNREAPDEPSPTDADRDDDLTSESSSAGPGSTVTAADASTSGSSGEAKDDELVALIDSDSGDSGSDDSSGPGSGSDEASSGSNSGPGGGDPDD